MYKYFTTVYIILFSIMYSIIQVLPSSLALKLQNYYFETTVLIKDPPSGPTFWVLRQPSPKVLNQNKHDALHFICSING